MKNSCILIVEALVISPSSVGDWITIDIKYQTIIIWKYDQQVLRYLFWVKFCLLYPRMLGFWHLHRYYLCTPSSVGMFKLSEVLLLFMPSKQLDSCVTCVSYNKACSIFLFLFLLRPTKWYFTKPIFRKKLLSLENHVTRGFERLVDVFETKIPRTWLILAGIHV